VIYLDHHAAAPATPGVRRAMADAEEVAWANPSSVHAAGRRARAVLEGAREAIAAAIGARPADVVLTAGGTDACNLGLRGLVAEGAGPGFVRTATEHPAVEATMADLAAGRGAEPVSVAVPAGVPPDPSLLAQTLRALGDRGVAGASVLVAIQWVNHEVGTVFPIPRYAEVCRSHGARLFVDGTQALGRFPVDVAGLGAHAVAFAAHKIGGPAGAGALWVDRAVSLRPAVTGGAQERGRRGGTPDVRAQAGFRGAVEALPDRLRAGPDMARRRDALEAATVRLGGVVNGDAGPRVPTVTNASFRRWQGAALVAALDLEGLAASSGAACSSGLDAPSPVLEAMYPDAPWRAGAALRLSVGPETSDEDVAEAVRLLERVVPRAG